MERSWQFVSTLDAGTWACQNTWGDVWVAIDGQWYLYHWDSDRLLPRGRRAK